MRKRTVALLLLLAALAGAAVSQAYLFALRQVTAENVITYGSLQMKLHETDGNGNEVSMKGDAILRLDAAQSPQTVKREITVENICQENMYLRMRLSIGGTSADGKTFMLSDEEVTCAVNTAGGWKRAPKDDGWYYYAHILTPGSATAHLLADNELVFNTAKIAQTHPNRPLSLSVEVQAVQSVHNPEGKTDVFAAQGWPEEVSKP